MSKGKKNTDMQAAPENDVCARHLAMGWWGLLFFLVLGVGLESMHGFKVGLYLDVSNETRRLMWTLAHAHGALLALTNIAFGLSTNQMPEWGGAARELASRGFVAALVLMPLGFFLGGLWVYGGDPSLGILLVPVGALALFVAVFNTARGASASHRRG
ncbi:MAG: hypothetical protein ACI8W3_001298 [Myxococcota bacterium]|jgi:hypothetical protein